jgi:hypothetical protein
MSLGIYRTTEDGNQRVLEDSVGLRVTENYQEGAATLVASSGFDFVGNLKLPATSNVSASSTLTATANVERFAVFMVANSSTISAAADRTTQGTTSLTATGTATVVPTFKGAALSNLVASGTASFDARTVKYVEVASGDVGFERILESEDARVTEDGDVRITNPIRTNLIESSMVANANVIPFSSIAYIKINGVWKQVVEIAAKDGSSWRINGNKIYRNMSGSWKRIY